MFLGPGQILRDAIESYHLIRDAFLRGRTNAIVTQRKPAVPDRKFALIDFDGRVVEIMGASKGRERKSLPPSHNSSQPPTSSFPLDIRNAADAQIIFEAVRLNILPMIRRRLGPTERDILRSGEIFVWEETDQKGGLERWTDGRRWSQSRMRGTDYTRLPVVEDYDYLRRIRVPKGIYVSSKGLQMSSDPYIDDDEEDYRSSSSPQSPTLYKSSGHVSPPPIYHHHNHHQSPSHYPMHEHSNYPSAPMSSPTYGLHGNAATDYAVSGYVYPTTNNATITSSSKYNSSSRSSTTEPTGKGYIPLTSEDRRALGAFRVAL
ncbi:hypothetical protein Clacol_008333 [Clathrus columnatus]|uniref:cAMP-independent regulatory protein pac2 n=1 Tax=Clathrus columnatus TaxID=1419009 RepID=A0AAV5ANU8_9AGAM|nr:hypothetical protein Clacol_008333 [Clathrus columnatus]